MARQPPQDTAVVVVAHETDTIGRFPHLLTHVREQLSGLAEGGDSFEEIRERYAKTMSALARRGLARVTQPRAGLGQAYRHWSSARDVIREFQTLGWLEPGPVPSSRQSVDQHRDRRYRLTEAGREAAAVAEDRRALSALLTGAALANHPYLRQLVEALADRPVFTPDLSEGLVKGLRTRRALAEHAADLLARSDPGLALGPEALIERMREAQAKRFGRRPPEDSRVTAKELAEAFTDAVAGLVWASRGVRGGATSMDALRSWGMELRLLDSSRYVPGHAHGLLTWLCCDLERDEGGQPRGARLRGFSEYGRRVGEALVEAYRALRTPKDTSLPIHAVRAAATQATGTAREVGDRTIEAMASGVLDLGVRVRPLAARFEIPPPSESMYARGGTRAMYLSMTGPGLDAAVGAETDHTEEDR